MDRADAVIEITEWVEVPKKNLTVENATSSPNISLETGTENSSEGSNENLHSDGDTINSSNSTVEEPNIIEQPTEKKLKKRTFRIPLKVTYKLTALNVFSHYSSHAI